MHDGATPQVASTADGDDRDRTATGARPRRAADWVSQGLEVLLADLDALERQRGDGTHFDVIIVGSGYGGAVAADRLAGLKRADGAPLAIAVLERGREYLRGAFPSTFDELPGHVRFTLPGRAGGRARGRLEGLFDLRVGRDMSVLVANGVGGGSLINAGVMLFPDDATWSDPVWPAALRRDDLHTRAARLRAELGASTGVHDNTWPPAGVPESPRRVAMRQLSQGGDAVRAAPITVATTAGQSSCAGVVLEACLGCGDCVTGCNHGAKVSLDVGLLRRAQRRGVRIVAGATVSALRPRALGGWEVDVWHTDLALRRRMAAPVALRAHRLILAAGTLGSTELLLRSRGPALYLSQRLGQRFSGNGDVLAAIYDARTEFNAIADEGVRPSQRHVGPTITTSLSLPAPAGVTQPACVVQDLAVPAALQRLMQEVTTTADLLHTLADGTTGNHTPAACGTDPLAVDSEKQRHSTVVALFVDDGAGGTLRPVPAPCPQGVDTGVWLDAGLDIEWPAARNDRRIEQAHRVLEHRMARSIGGRLLRNPLWRPLPEPMADALGIAVGGLVTVHPLGGCAMGRSRDDGVVDDMGRVFDADPARRPTDVHEGLYVLDGAIVPRALGVNPALTIAVLADRAIEGLITQWRAEGWLATAQATTGSPAGRETRPVFAHDTDRARPRARTEVQVVERLCGAVDVDGRRLYAELSLAYRSVALPGPDQPLRGWSLDVQPDARLSMLRLFDTVPPHDGARVHDVDAQDAKPGAGGRFEEPDDREALCCMPITSGTLRVLHREASSALQRRWRAAVAYWCNRGARDLWQALEAWLEGGRPPRIAGLWGLLDRAGEVRRFDYDLVLEPTDDALQALQRLGLHATRAHPWRVHGHKRLTYARRASPWQQLMRLHLDMLGPCRLGEARRLEVDPLYFVMLRHPLIRITQMQNLPVAFADLASFALYLLRVLASIHLWSLRQPDVAPTRTPARKPQRLPATLPGLPEPQIFHLNPGDGAGGELRLTRYEVPRRLPDRPPVLLIHGYSASGTTFAHPALQPSLAEVLWRHGHEPWVLDLRTSVGLPTSRRRWRFEQIAATDIPLALEAVCEKTGHAAVDVVSHCMGSAMLAMAVLGPDDVAQRVVPRVRRWVMSQITPAMRFSAGNMLRAYLWSQALNVLPQLDYRIGSDRPRGGDWLDRLLSTLPYLDDDEGSEFDIENPPWWTPWVRTPWVRTRHRLDALFGRVFDARRVPRQVLEHLDDFFGDIDLGTAAQTLLFARHGFVADWDSDPDRYRSRAARHGGCERLPMQILSLHSRGNGLAHWTTALEVKALAAHGTWPRARWRQLLVERAGHQDVFIGDAAACVAEAIVDFLSAPQPSP